MRAVDEQDSAFMRAVDPSGRDGGVRTNEVTHVRVNVGKEWPRPLSISSNVIVKIVATTLTGR